MAPRMAPGHHPEERLGGIGVAVQASPGGWTGAVPPVRPLTPTSLPRGATSQSCTRVWLHPKGTRGSPLTPLGGQHAEVPGTKVLLLGAITGKGWKGEPGGSRELAAPTPLVEKAPRPEIMVRGAPAYQTSSDEGVVLGASTPKGYQSKP